MIDQNDWKQISWCRRSLFCSIIMSTINIYPIIQYILKCKKWHTRPTTNKQKQEIMEKAKKLLLELIQEEERRRQQQTQSCVSITNQHGHDRHSFYEAFALKGIRVDRVESGCIICTFMVPPRLTNAVGNLCSGAIANIIDEVGGAVVHVDGLPRSVSLDMSISYLSTAKVNDELEIISRALGKKGGYSGTIVLLRNKATREVIAEGRHALFSSSRI
ncbi:hypothetical protein AQUCO_00900749v1 [Aquilegia coerulea]|uniref:Acyl-coenzyme A thioesterase 13 n=1 Tax=Aquilegia coerulea TaxID=218851 RepID=A0A2G5EF83_AQUCA|nr:hypothetical protein AQUCO_00900749v1 [Aquilegia coerulea]